MERTLEDIDPVEGNYLDDRRMQQYGNLFFLLQSEPRHIASLCRLVSLTEIDTLLQTVMFTLYGNQYESREEHLLLTMFQVSPYLESDALLSSPFLVCAICPVRNRYRVWISVASKHTRFSNDDYIHASRTRSKLPEERPRGTN